MKTFEINKIPLEPLIASLVEVYDTGADFIDIVGTISSIQDRIGIRVRDRYYHQEKKPEKLCENDINQLLL